MELALLKASETALLANDVHTKLEAFTEVLGGQTKMNFLILAEAIRITDKLGQKLDDKEFEDLTKMLKLIDMLIQDRIANFCKAVELQQWSNSMTEKYVADLETLNERFGYDLN